MANYNHNFGRMEVLSSRFGITGSNPGKREQLEISLDAANIFFDEWIRNQCATLPDPVPCDILDIINQIVENEALYTLYMDSEGNSAQAKLYLNVANSQLGMLVNILKGDCNQGTINPAAVITSSRPGRGCCDDYRKDNLSGNYYRPRDNCGCGERL
jgi:hypothetical protein